MTAAVTPAEAKAAWESIDNPSSRKVSEKLAAAGRKVSFKTVAKWKREGWPGADNPAAAAEKAVVAATSALEPVVAQVAGDATASPKAIIIEDDGQTNNSALTERTLRKLILGAERMTEELYANMVAHALSAPEVTANSLAKLGLAINTAAEGLATLAVLRADEMKSVPGAVEVIPPSLEDKIKAHPLRASLEAYGKAAKEAAR